MSIRILPRNSHDCYSPFYLDYRFLYPGALVLRSLIPDVAVSHIVRVGHRSFLALLFSRVATGRSLTRCAHGQTKRSFRNSLCGHCSSRNANVASLAWRRTCADRCGHPGLEIMKAAGCKSDESKQFLSLKFGNLGLVHQFASVIAPGFTAETPPP